MILLIMIAMSVVDKIAMSTAWIDWYRIMRVVISYLEAAVL